MTEMNKVEEEDATDRSRELFYRVSKHVEAYQAIGEEVPNFRISKSEAKDWQDATKVKSLPQKILGVVLEYAFSDFHTVSNENHAFIQQQIEREEWQSTYSDLRKKPAWLEL